MGIDVRDQRPDNGPHALPLLLTANSSQRPAHQIEEVHGPARQVAADELDLPDDLRRPARSAFAGGGRVLCAILARLSGRRRVAGAVLARPTTRGLNRGGDDTDRRDLKGRRSAHGTGQLLARAIRATARAGSDLGAPTTSGRTGGWASLGDPLDTRETAKRIDGKGGGRAGNGLGDDELDESSARAEVACRHSQEYRTTDARQQQEDTLAHESGSRTPVKEYHSHDRLPTLGPMTGSDKLPDRQEGLGVIRRNHAHPVALDNALIESVKETVMNGPRVLILGKQLESEVDHGSTGVPVVLSHLHEQPRNSGERRPTACDLDGLATRSYEKNE